MGYDERQQSSSSGTAVAIVVTVLLVAFLGIAVVGGATLFWVRTARMEAVTRERTVAELRRIGAEAHRAEAEVQTEVEVTEATPDPRLNFVLTVNREGNVSHEGDGISLDRIRVQLAKLKDESSNAFTVYINADPETPVKHIIQILDVCEKVGDIDYRVKLPLGSPLEGDS